MPVGGARVGLFGSGIAIPDSVINRWPIQQGTGTTLTDVVGDDDGSFVGDPQWEDDPTAIENYLLTFDGTDDGVNTSATVPTGSRTLAVTVDFSSDISAFKRLHVYDETNAGAGFTDITFSNNGTNTIIFEISNDANNIRSVGYTLPSTGRYRVVGVLDTISSEIKIAVNGSVENTESVSGSFTTSTGNHALGYRRTQNKNYLNASLDEPLTANGAYTSTQITEDYQRQPWS